MKDNIYIIAEAGVNHNGSLNKALKLVDIAKKSGADAVKFQIFRTDLVVSKNAPLAQYQKNKGLKNQKDLIKKLELSKKDFIKIYYYCKKVEIKFLCTPFDNQSLNFLLNKLKLNTIKISSGDINNLPIIYQIGKHKKKIILSTGNSNLEDIDLALKAYLSGFLKNSIKSINDILKINIKKFIKILAKKVTIMHCVSSYPTLLKDINLNYINTLRTRYNYLNLGLSDHTVEVETPLLAMAMGVKVVEKHFTINKFLRGPDHKASLSPIELSKMISLIRKYEKSLGSKNKNIILSEKKNLNIVRRSLYANNDIHKGEKFSMKNIVLKRPFKKYSDPKDIFGILGKVSKKNYRYDQIIKTKGD